jgi:hypothetical protein
MLSTWLKSLLHYSARSVTATLFRWCLCTLKEPLRVSLPLQIPPGPPLRKGAQYRCGWCTLSARAMMDSTEVEKRGAVRTDETIDAIELYYAQGWTDGLPVVPPTRAKVHVMVKQSGRAASEVIAELPPQGGKATVERIATNAVMAGCLPEYMPVVLTALEAMLETRFNLRGVLCSTHVSTPLLILNGPIVQALHVNSGHNVFGPGWRANATIGRAVQLALVDIGGAQPGVLDKVTFGHPGKYSDCIAENEAASPWEPLHVERGFQCEDSTVTVYPAEAPHNSNNQPW